VVLAGCGGAAHAPDPYAYDHARPLAVRDPGVALSGPKVAMHVISYDAAKRVNPDILVLCHGGPIAEPDDAAFVIERTEGVVGFFGASSMERLPIETAMTENMRRFKAIASGKGKV
jgi:predicted TIM-barrel enzyme